nr:hypothetical protein [uncultured Anaerotignum sp.]
MIPFAWGDVLPYDGSVVLGMMFLALCLQLFYLLWSVEYYRKAVWLLSALWEAMLFELFLLLYSREHLHRVPLLLILAVILLSLLFTAGVTVFTARKRKHSISRGSIKEAMDDLPIAGCYFTKNGVIKLCNLQMYALYSEMTGEILQSLDGLHAAVTAHTENGIYRADGGRVWSYTERTVTVQGRPYTETLFTDITEVFLANEELQRGNEELARINKKLKKMFNRAADRIREREQLAFKLKIHDEIGHSLSVIRRMLQGKAEEADAEKQIRELSLAAGTLIISPLDNSTDPYDRLLNECAELGVELKRNGMLPVEPEIYDLLVSALRECVTNCVRHAHGTQVLVRIRGVPGGYSVRITNDGEKPRQQIIEGGGLSDLRQSIESAGGRMQLSHSPAFVMWLTFMREEMNL